MQAERLGRFELIRHLASGGMAQVYLARVSGLAGFQRHVALKTLRTENMVDESYINMFLDEARLVATLHHQHVAQVYEVGCTDGTYFLAMEYVHGETVRAVLERAVARGRRVPLEFSLSVACAAAAGLHHSHERCGPDGAPLHIVHRDVSPSNVIVSYDGSIKLIDFGIAKADARSTKTLTGLVKGKVGYMAPEQARGDEIDRRSDVFALGILIYELTTQHRAFNAPTQIELIQLVAHGAVPPPSDLVKDYPLELEHVVMTALELDPDDRFQDADEMRRALEAVASSRGLALGGQTVIEVLADLFGPRPEPWLTPAPRVRAPTPGSSTESRPMLALPAHRSPPPPPPQALLASRRRMASPVPADEAPPVPADEAPTHEFESIEISAATPRPGPPPLPPPPAPRTHRMAVPRVGLRSIAVIGGFVAFAAGIGIAILMRSTGQPAAAAAPPAATVVAAAPAPPPAPRPAPPADPVPAPLPLPAARAAGTVHLRVTTDPPGATVVLDGVRLGTSPYEGDVAAKDRPGMLKVRKGKAYAPMKKRIALDGADVVWEIALPPRS